MRILDSVLFFLFGGVVGVLLYISLWEKGEKRNPMPNEKQQVLLERIKKVAKLITVEGDYTTTHEYKDYFWADISMFGKKAIVQTKARIFVGFDLQKAQFEADSLTKTIRVRNLPTAEVLSIDHDLEFPFLTEGMFNNFSDQDLTDINIVVKKKLRDSSTVAPLLAQARTEGIETLDVIRVLVEQGGWRLEIIQDSLNPPARPVTIPSEPVKPFKQE
jgi:hypothetical protein